MIGIKLPDAVNGGSVVSYGERDPFECGDLSPLWFAAEPLSFDASDSDQELATEKDRSTADESGDESPHSKDCHRCAVVHEVIDLILRRG